MQHLVPASAPGAYGSPGYPTQTGAGQPQVPRVGFQQNKSVFRYGETSIWSTLAYAGGVALANDQNGRAFSTALGQTGQGFSQALTLPETNLRVGGFVPDGQAFDVFGITALVMFSDAASADTGDFDVAVNGATLVPALLNVLHNAVASWNFTQATIDIAPLHLIGAGGGAFGAISTTQNAADVGHMNNGAGSVWLYRKFPIALPGNVTFAILNRFGSRAGAVPTSNALGIKFALLGYYRNVVEAT